MLVCGIAVAQTPVIVVSIDTLRADRLSAYGCRSIRTPQIDSFAEHGTLFSSIAAQVPLTLPSHTTLFTSTYPFENGIQENAEPVPPGAVTLASVLKAQGYATAAFIGSVFLEKEMGLDFGFELYDSPFHFEAFSPLSGSMFFGGDPRNSIGVRDRRDGSLVFAAAERWLAANRNSTPFTFIHLFDLHKPYRLGSYEAEVAYVDQLLGKFRDFLVKNGYWDRSIVVVLSDHGEGLGEHGESSHGYFIYESTLWVPLLIHWPQTMTGLPGRITTPGGLIDAAPTLVDVLHIPLPAAFHGHSLLGPASPVYAETMHTRDAFGWAPLRSLRWHDYKYIDAPRPELYRLDSDSHEQKNLIAQEPGKAHEMRTMLEHLIAAHPPKTAPGSQPMSPQTRRLLTSLGYLGTGPKTPNRSHAPDPKDRLPEFQMYERAQVLLYDRRLDQAIATLHSLLSQDPANLLARRDLGSCYIEKHQYAEARQAFERVLASSPSDYVALYEIGLAEEHLNQLADASRHLQAACEVAPDAAQCRLELDAVAEKLHANAR